VKAIGAPVQEWIDEAVLPVASPLGVAIADTVVRGNQYGQPRVPSKLVDSAFSRPRTFHVQRQSQQRAPICRSATYDPMEMSDIEHEFVIENESLRGELARVREVARRALEAAKEAQDHATGSHDAWLDEALAKLTLQGA
jgi:hypothetical protein